MFPLLATLQVLGPLKARVVDAVPDAPVTHVVVLLHGFGAPGDDLVELARYLPRERGLRYVFPEAPLSLGDGRAWWMIDWNERARYERAGDWVGYAALVPEGLAEASAALDGMLTAIEAQWKVESRRIVLGGFSQGAMLSLDVAARRKKKPGALVLMSGSMIATPRWLGHKSSLAGQPIFMSHGESDAVLPYFAAEKLRDTLGEAGARIAWVPFAGGHGIPPDVLRALGIFLEEVF